MTTLPARGVRTTAVRPTVIGEASGPGVARTRQRTGEGGVWAYRPRQQATGHALAAGAQTEHGI